MEHYIFTPTTCEAGMEEELAAALEKRTEIVSRAEYPKMWKATDALNRYAARGGKRRGPLRKVLSWVLILAGLFLAIPGMMEPKELRIPLITGVLSVLLGVLYLLSTRPVKKNDSFRQAAVKLLQSMSHVETANVQVVFDDTGMRVDAQGSTGSVSYADMEMLVETPHLYLLTYGGQVTVLQKKDLTGDPEAFAGFLAAQAVGVYRTKKN